MNLFTRSTILAVTMLLGLMFVTLSAVYANDVQPTWQVNGFDQPESVVAGPKGLFLYVSNINGQPAEENGKGYISKLTIDGKVVKQHWITGMNAPKGMKVFKGSLFVADMQQLHVIDLASERLVKTYYSDDAKMLNDIAIDGEGTLFLTDLLGGGIYQLKHERIEPWFHHNKLPHSNGILWHQGKLIIANWGEGMNDDFSTQVLGSLYELDLQTKKLSTVKHAAEIGNLDGIFAMGDSLFVSDWVTGDIFKITPSERKRVLKLNQGVADIGGESQWLYTPMMMNGQIMVWNTNTFN